MGNRNGRLAGPAGEVQRERAGTIIGRIDVRFLLSFASRADRFLVYERSVS